MDWWTHPVCINICCSHVSMCSYENFIRGLCQDTADQHNYQEELIPLFKVLRRAVLACSYVIHSASCLNYILKSEKLLLLFFYLIFTCDLSSSSTLTKLKYRTWYSIELFYFFAILQLLNIKRSETFWPQVNFFPKCPIRKCSKKPPNWQSFERQIPMSKKK